MKKLSAPKQATFLIAVVLAVLGLLSSLVSIPVLSGYSFWLVFVGFVVLALGTMLGTVGGALRMNAGAFGGETWEKVIEVDVVDRRGQVRTRGRDDYQVAYRDVRSPLEEWFLAARFKFAEQYTAAADRIRTLVSERKERQPLGLPSCGSVFKNPPGDHAARLIEAAGLKGTRVGGAEVSPKHANFIINTGGATAADIETLVGQVRAAVEARYGVRLDTEVQIVGEPAGTPAVRGAW